MYVQLVNTIFPAHFKKTTFPTMQCAHCESSGVRVKECAWSYCASVAEIETCSKVFPKYHEHPFFYFIYHQHKHDLKYYRHNARRADQFNISPFKGQRLPESSTRVEKARAQGAEMFMYECVWEREWECMFVNQETVFFLHAFSTGVK